jgi:bloom syndrome protein
MRAEFKNISRYTKDIISLLQNLSHEKVTINHCIDIYRGANNQKMRQSGYSELELYGRGKSFYKKVHL